MLASTISGRDSSSDLLFQQQIPMRIECSSRQVTVTVIQQQQVQTLQITLTDEDDPFFLYHLEISPDDFVELKNTQNLLIQFSQFPSKFVQLLQDCMGPQKTLAKLSLHENPTFAAIFTPSSNNKEPSKLSLVETNSFKEISHLTLGFTPGADADLKRYLASLVTNYKSENVQLIQKLKETEISAEKQINGLQNELQSVKRDLESIRMETSGRESRMKIEMSSQLQMEKDRINREKEQWIRECELNKSALINKYEQQISSNSAQLISLQQGNEELSSRVKLMETQLGEVTKIRDRLMSENSTLSQQKQKMEFEIREFSSIKQQLTSTVDVQSKQILSLEKHLAEKQSIITSLRDAERKQFDGQKLAEDTVLTMRQQISQLQQQIQQHSSDNSKANEIIMKMQSELKNTKGKLKLKNVVASQQEKLLEDKQAIVDASQKELSELKLSIQSKDDRLKQLESSVEDLTCQLEKSRKVIEENNSVIEWLHRQLNDDVMRKPIESIKNHDLKVREKIDNFNLNVEK